MIRGGRELVASVLIHQDLSIDGYQSRNERLADLMRRFGICEEKSSGIDRVVSAAEAYQLPASDFRAGHRRTVVTIYGPKPFEAMDRDDRVRACYQHSALKWVMSERMTNQSLRERFRLPESRAAIASQVIAATIEAGFIKLDEKVGGSRKFARYLPFWA
jgi:ATP-dependent DNA helicase RecG